MGGYCSTSSIRGSTVPNVLHDNCSAFEIVSSNGGLFDSKVGTNQVDELLSTAILSSIILPIAYLQLNQLEVDERDRLQLITSGEKARNPSADGGKNQIHGAKATYQRVNDQLKRTIWHDVDLINRVVLRLRSSKFKVAYTLDSRRSYCWISA